MKNNVLLLFLLAGLFASAQNETPQEIKKAKANRDKYLFAVKTEPRKFDQTIATEYITDEILVPVRMNGKTYTFLFDSGAITILSSELIKELGLEAVTSNKFVDSAGNRTEENFYIVPEITLGSVSFRNVGAGSFDLSKFSQLLCRRIDGIFGSNMMRTCNWEIDYDKPSVRLSSEKIALADSDRVPFSENFSGSPRVRIDVGGFNFLADVDTGNNGSLDIPADLFRKSRLRNSARIATNRGKSSFSFLDNPEQEELAVMADSVYIGNVLLRRRLRVSPSPMLLIGNDFFSPLGKFAINYKKQELLLPRKQSAPKPEPTFGFAPLQQDGKIYVWALWQGSEAEKQGLALQDEIVSFNGKAVSGMTETEWCGFRLRLIENDSLAVVARKPDGKTILMTLARYDVLGTDVRK